MRPSHLEWWHDGGDAGLELRHDPKCARRYHTPCLPRCESYHDFKNRVHAKKMKMIAEGKKDGEG